MVKARKVPMRMCSGCGQQKSKKELVRIVRSPDGEVSLDLKGKKSGRGAYICPDAACLRLARKSRKIERSLECPIPDEVYGQIEEELTREQT